MRVSGGICNSALSLSLTLKTYIYFSDKDLAAEIRIPPRAPPFRRFSSAVGNFSKFFTVLCGRPRARTRDRARPRRPPSFGRRSPWREDLGRDANITKSCINPPSFWHCNITFCKLLYFCICILSVGLLCFAKTISSREIWDIRTADRRGSEKALRRQLGRRGLVPLRRRSGGVPMPQRFCLEHIMVIA